MKLLNRTELATLLDRKRGDLLELKWPKNGPGSDLFLLQKCTGKTWQGDTGFPVFLLNLNIRSFARRHKNRCEGVGCGAIRVAELEGEGLRIGVTIEYGKQGVRVAANKRKHPTLILGSNHLHLSMHEIGKLFRSVMASR